MQTVNTKTLPIAVRYARALLAAAGDAAGIATTERDVQQILPLLGQGSLLDHLLKTLHYGRADARPFLQTLATSCAFGAPLAHLLRLLAQNRRLPCLADILRAFITQASLMRNESHATLTTAVPVPADGLTSLSTALSARLNKKILLDNRVDPSIISGAILSVDSTMLDTSLGAYLKALENKMRQAVLCVH